MNTPFSPGPDYTGWLPGLDAICYGGDYNPEQWPEEVWEQDVALMKEAGVNLVSIGIFSWALLEPRDGEFDFAWLDRLIELLHSHGIRVDLGTPTASPPAWFFRQYPESRVVTKNGTVLGFGSRGMAAPSSSDYRRHAVRIATQLAERYGTHPALALWHVHNEYGAPVGEDFSAHAQRAWRTWLRDRYVTLDALNAAWGTRFWGQVYGDWQEVGVPAATPSIANPAQRLDFARFTDAMLRECFVAERDAIRAHSTVPITTNFMAVACPATDLFAWGREVDIVSNDHYLWAADPRNYVTLALAADLTRSVAGGKPWMLLEHSTSGVNWQPRNVAKRAGEEQRNAFSHLGRGADAIMFFQWRASRSGAEKFHSAMIPHAGTNSRIWREVVSLGSVLGQLGELRGSRTQADVAILWDQESLWAQGLEWRPSEDLQAGERIQTFYDRLWRDGVTVDLAHPSSDLSAYRLVVAPASYLLTQASAANLTRYVEGGGTLLVSCFSGVVDEFDRVHEGGFMAPLRDALGVQVEELLPLREGESLSVVGLSPSSDDEAAGAVTGTVWAEALMLGGAEVVGTYASGPAAGDAAITRHTHGAGTGWYLSTVLDADALAPLMQRVYADAGVVPSDLPEDVEVLHRVGEGTEWTVAINHTDADAAVPVGTGAMDALSGAAVDGAVKVPAGEVRVLRRAR
ncbi:Beta-galactosidase [Xylanimonas cellulosilytica DSM 15894]|uniref:Beta-galactosidase n=1 Tax=Xylanimonas cellulosilytica (strain DSM 15894 / JCM 12276 / CECT 5975 / KCTC 9989 / LMG 20990 / NBRC 107835 / XIL07) TaxID=446471 RepID=D1BUF6_XYLCX|nr:beta-galactosidase [Xylanimonas cellulosilytica]ACZ31169.1 Beta-galactosidase [Xylanimonas cellulosilytica DSM 15894]